MLEFTTAIRVLAAALLLTLSSTSMSKTLKVGVQDFKFYLPFSEHVNGEYRGFNREVLDLFASKSGHKLVYIALPLKRLYDRFLNSNELDLKYPDNSYWTAGDKASAAKRRGGSIVYSDSVVTYTDGLMVLPSRAETKRTELGAGFKSIGILAGFTPFVYLDLIKQGVVRLEEQHSFEGLLKKGIAGRVDGIYSNIAVTKYYLETKFGGGDKLKFAKHLPHTTSTRHLSTWRHPDVIKQFNAFLKTEAVALAKLKKKYRLQ